MVITHARVKHLMSQGQAIGRRYADNGEELSPATSYDQLVDDGHANITVKDDGRRYYVLDDLENQKTIHTPVK